MWRVDGSRGQGGGQILRIACGLAVAAGQPVEVDDIRADRDKPGLRPQHVAALEGLAALCDGDLAGADVGSTHVELGPGPVQGGTVKVDVGTAGSVTLVLQALLPACLAADGPVRLEVQGGTDVKWSPQWDFFERVFVSHLHNMGVGVQAALRRRGHYPEGGGRVVVTVDPGTPDPPSYGPPDRRAVTGRVHLTDLPDHIADRMRKAALDNLPGVQDQIPVDTTPGTTGTGIVLHTVEHPRLGADEMGEPGRPAEEVGRACAKALQRDLEARVSVDPRTADQILPYLAVAGAPSSFTVREVTGHLATLAGLLGDLGVADVQLHQGTVTTVAVQPRGVVG